MWASALKLFANTFVVIYAVDAAFPLVQGAIPHLTGGEVPSSWRSIVAPVVILDSLLVLPGMMITPRLVPSVLAPLALSALWLKSGAAPLPLLLAPSALVATTSSIQLAVAMFSFLRMRALSGGRTWFLDDEAASRPAFSIAHSLVALAATALGTVVLVFAYAPLWILTSVHSITDGFVHFDLEGISLADRRYELGDQQIRLVGMMHIGETDAYEALVETFSGPPSVILEEGVTDREELLEQAFSYEAVARVLGLDTQRSLETYFDGLKAPEQGEWPSVRHADVDLSDFHPDSITWLVWTAKIWDGDDPAAAFEELYVRYAEDPERWSVVQEDVLTLRNLHLLEELQASLRTYDRVIVPWGALHLPFLERRVLAMGFEPTSRTYHPLASWKTIVAALRAPPEGGENVADP